MRTHHRSHQAPEQRAQRHRGVTFDEFEALAWQHWERVPSEYRTGVDGLMIERDAKTHPDLDEVYTLGECVTEEFPSPYGGPETTRSAVVLYYGSFHRLARLEPEFDWEREIWETLTHELQHHLETMATEDALEDVDYAIDENYKRLAGESFDPLFFRAGEQVQPNGYRVEDDVFLEVERPRQPHSTLEFVWEGQRFRIAPPQLADGIAFVRVNAGPDVDGDFFVVVVPRRGVLGVLRAALRPQETQVSEVEAVAEALGPE